MHPRFVCVLVCAYVCVCSCVCFTCVCVYVEGNIVLQYTDWWYGITGVGRKKGSNKKSEREREGERERL